MMTFKNDKNSEGLLLVSPFVLYIYKRIKLTPNLSNVTVIKIQTTPVLSAALQTN